MACVRPSQRGTAQLAKIVGRWLAHPGLIRQPPARVAADAVQFRAPVQQATTCGSATRVDAAIGKSRCPGVTSGQAMAGPPLAAARHDTRPDRDHDHAVASSRDARPAGADAPPNTIVSGGSA
jgi:hypothetical protein